MLCGLCTITLGCGLWYLGCTCSNLCIVYAWGLWGAFAMSSSSDSCVETKTSSTYCIYTYIYAPALLLSCLCKSVVVLWYTAAMLLLCGCCCYAAVAMRLCCCCLSLNVFSFYALAFHGISFAILFMVGIYFVGLRFRWSAYGWNLFSLYGLLALTCIGTWCTVLCSKSIW